MSLLKGHIDHRGKTVAKETFRARLFNINNEVSFNTSQAYISQLGHSLGQTDIETTTYGFGYRAQTKNSAMN